MEIKARAPLFALLASLIAICILAFSSFFIAIPIYFILKWAAIIESCKDNFIITWAVITIIRSAIPTNKTQSIYVKL